jgi:broad specificity phosphatase PhoE
MPTRHFAKLIKDLSEMFRCRPATRRRHYIGLFLIAGLTGSAGLATGSGGDELARMMHSGQHVLLVRHAYAPGTGDPAEFSLGDCSTQRNLSDEGRAQASSMGAWLRHQGIDNARLYSSEWCRCVETAERMGLGPVTPLPALNSFYERPEDRAPNLAALKDFLAAQPPQEEPLVLVTHQVTISALTGDFVASGEGVLARIGEDGAVTPVRSVDFGR